jgi:hypothetical protein
MIRARRLPPSEKKPADGGFDLFRSEAAASCPGFADFGDRRVSDVEAVASAQRYVAAQFSTRSPGTRENSRVLLVTSVTPIACACAAIWVS